MDLVPDLSPWIDSKCNLLESVFPANDLGIEYQYDCHLGRCESSHLATESLEGRHIRQANILGNYILIINELDLNKQDLGTSRMVWAIGMIGAIATQRAKKALAIPRISAYGI